MRICINLFLICVFLFSGFKFVSTLIKNWNAQREFNILAEEVESADHTASPVTYPSQTEPQMLAKYSTLYEQNSDLAGWIKIPGTELNYPVMYTPDDTEYYLRRSFEKKDSISGTPFIGYDCTLEPRSDNIIIYGHNMSNGSMFNTLVSYENEEFWNEHKIIQFDTLYETGTYNVMAVFNIDVSLGNGHFEFYEFTNAENSEDYFSYVNKCRELTFYDTGVIPDDITDMVTLVTCASDNDNERFVIVAVKNDV